MWLSIGIVRSGGTIVSLWLLVPQASLPQLKPPRPSLLQTDRQTHQESLMTLLA